MNQESNTEKHSEDTEKKPPLTLRHKKASPKAEKPKGGADAVPSEEADKISPDTLSLRNAGASPATPATPENEVPWENFELPQTGGGEATADKVRTTDKSAGAEEDARPKSVLKTRSGPTTAAKNKPAQDAEEGLLAQASPVIRKPTAAATPGANQAQQADSGANEPPASDAQTQATLSAALGNIPPAPCGHPVRSAILIFLALILLLGGIGGIGYALFKSKFNSFWGNATEESATAAETPVAETPAAEKPAQSGPISRTRALTRDVSAKASVDEIIETPVTPTPPPEVDSAATPAAPAPAATTPPAVATPPAAPPAPPPEKPAGVPTDPDPEVVRYIENLRPTGVRGNRMLLDGQLYETGEWINRQLGIRWLYWDQQLGVLTFEDRNGMRYEKDI